MDGHNRPQRPKMTKHMERKFTQQHDGGLATTGEGRKTKKKKKNRKYMQLFQIPTLQLSPLAFTAAGISNPTVTI